MYVWPGGFSYRCLFQFQTQKQIQSLGKSLKMNESDKLREWNERFAERHMGATVFLTIMIFFGLIGNVHVACIYITQFGPSKKRIFFIWMSVLDTLACLIALPFHVIDFNSHVRLANVQNLVCKIFQFTSYVLTVGSTFMLLVFTVDIYNMICRPHRRQLANREIQYACAFTLIIVMGIICSPTLYVYGHRHEHNRDLGISATTCGIENTRESAYTIYMSFFCGLIYTVIAIFIGIYCLIFKHLGKRATAISSSTSLDKSSSFKSSTSDLRNASAMMVVKHRVEKKKRKQRENRRISCTLLSLSSVAMVSWLPFLLLKTTESIVPGIFSSLSSVQDVVYRTLYVSPHFIMVNAIIYSACDRTFRQVLQDTYHRMFERLTK